MDSEFLGSSEICLESIQTLKLSFGSFFPTLVMTSEFEQAILCGGLLPNLETFPGSNHLVQNVKGTFLLNSQRKIILWLPSAYGAPSCGIFLLEVKMLF